jgi:hypothetical protein
MNASNNLVNLKHSLMHRGAILRLLVDSLAPPFSAGADRLVSYVTIEALNAWGSFVRAYYLSCCVYRARRVSGKTVTFGVPRIANTTDALFWACKVVKGAKYPPVDRRQEPAWHDPNTLLRTFAVLGASNLGEVQAAFSYSTDAFEYLPTLRNFFAHRNENTMDKVRNVARHLGVNPHQRASEIVCNTVAGRPQSVLVDWLDDLSIVAMLLCV